MAKLSLIPAPTFRASVPVPRPGADSVDVPMTFRHRSKKQLAEWIDKRAERSDRQSFDDMVLGWQLEEPTEEGAPVKPVPFDAEHIDAILDAYPGLALATYYTYVEELTKARRGN